MHNGVAFVMGTPRLNSPPGAIAVILAAAALAGACSLGGAPVGASHSPSAGHAQSPLATASPLSSPPQSAPSPAGPPPTPVVGRFGVLVTDQSASSYTVSLVAVDGKVAASSQTSTPPLVTCPGPAGAPLPLPVSTSNSRAYYMDAQGVVRYLAPNGDSGRATAVPGGTTTRRSMFAVSPDDQRIAVIVNDYTSGGASTKLYVENLNGGGNHLDIYSRSGTRTLWPIGWHGPNNLVVAVVPSCTQGGGPFCCGIQELHVVDPATATRRFTLGSIDGCVIAGAASPAGAICWDGSQGKVLDWTAGTVRTYPEPKAQLQYLSPNGSKVALVDDGGTSLQGTNSSMAGLVACMWMDDSHLLAGGDVQRQPRVLDVTSGATIPVAAEGTCAGRLPGGL